MPDRADHIPEDDELFDSVDGQGNVVPAVDRPQEARGRFGKMYDGMKKYVRGGVAAASMAIGSAGVVTGGNSTEAAPGTPTPNNVAPGQKYAVPTPERYQAIHDGVLAALKGSPEENIGRIEMLLNADPKPGIAEKWFLWEQMTVQLARSGKLAEAKSYITDVMTKGEFLVDSGTLGRLTIQANKAYATSSASLKASPDALRAILRDVEQNLAAEDLRDHKELLTSLQTRVKDPAFVREVNVLNGKVNQITTLRQKIQNLENSRTPVPETVIGKNKLDLALLEGNTNAFIANAKFDNTDPNVRTNGPLMARNEFANLKAPQLQQLFLYWKNKQAASTNGAKKVYGELAVACAHKLRNSPEFASLPAASRLAVMEYLQREGGNGGLESANGAGSVDILSTLDLAKMDKKFKRGNWQQGKSVVDRREVPSIGVKATESNILYFPGKIDGDYNLDVDFVRVEGQDAIHINFPVGDSQCTLVLSGWNGKFSGISKIRGMTADNRMNASSRNDIAIVNNKRYQVKVDVKYSAQGKANITVLLDGTPIVELKDLALQTLSSHDDFVVPDEKTQRPMTGVGVGAWNATVRFDKIQVNKTGSSAVTSAQVRK